MKSKAATLLVIALTLLAEEASAETPRQEATSDAPVSPAAESAAPDEAAAPVRGSREYLIGLVQRGAKHYDAGEYAAAIIELREAYALKSSPTIGVVLAHAYRDSEQWGPALDMYETTAETEISEDAHPKIVQAVETAKTELVRLQGTVVWLTLTVDGPQSFTASFNGEPMDPHRSGAYLLGPGTYSVQVSAEGYETATLEFAAEPGSRLTQIVKLKAVASAAPTPVAAEPPPAPAPAPVSPPKSAPMDVPSKRSEAYATWGTASLITGLVGAAGGGALAMYAMIEEEQSTQFCTDNVCSADAGPHLDRAKTAANVATITFVVSGALVATGIGLLIYDGIDESNHRRDQLAIQEVKLSASPTGATLLGRF